MAGLAKMVSVAGTVMTVFGKLSDARSARQYGKAQQAYAEQTANQVFASAQRDAMEEKRRAKLLASRALAVAGGGASDPTVMNVIADIEGEGAYRAAMEIYGGESQAEKLRTQGAFAAMQGKQASRRYTTQALASGVKSYVDYDYKYGKKGGKK